jgi:hypothetical protein
MNRILVGMILCSGTLGAGCVSVLDIDVDTTGSESGDTQAADVETGQEECTDPPCCEDPDTEELRPIQHPLPGDIEFSEVMPDPMSSWDADGEWIELHVNDVLPGEDGYIDLNDITLRRGGNPDSSFTEILWSTHDTPECAKFWAGEYVLLGKQGGQNVMGLGNKIDETFSFNIINGEMQGLYLDSDDVKGIAGVTYETLPGASWARDAATELWCFSAIIYAGSGRLSDLGTPGGPNPTCM